MKSAAFFLATLMGVLCATTGCEPEVGSPCHDDPTVMEDFVRTPEGNTLRQDLTYENCSKAFCMSTDNSRPYCTRRCESNLDCGADGFNCEAAIRFGSLGCKDWNADTECEESENPYLYCTAESASVISQRDSDFGRDLE